MKTNLFPQNQIVTPIFDLKSLYLTVLKSLFTVMLVFLSVAGWGQTNPTPQTLPYSQNYGTALFTSMPSGTAAWNGLNGGTVVTQALAESSVPTGNATLSQASVANTTGGSYGFMTASNACYYVQTTGNNGNGVNQLAAAINTGVGVTSVNLSYDIRVISSQSAIMGVVLQYRAGTTGSWTTISGSALSYNSSSSNGGDADTAGDTDTYLYNVSGLTASTNYQFRWATWKGTGTGTGLGFDNLSFSAGAPTITSAQTGNWSSTLTWVGGIVPTSADNAVIASTHVVTMDNATYSTRNSGTTTTVNAGGTLATSVQYINKGTTTVNGTFQLNAGGYSNTDNNFVYGAAGTLIFNNTSSFGVNNTDQFWPTASGPFNVTILQGGMTLNSGANRTVDGVFQTSAGVTLTGATLTLNGTNRINTGGFFNNSPIYGSASTLVYNNGAAFGRGNEWTTATSGAGYPANVQISNPGTFTTVNMGATSAQCSGNLIIDASATLNTTSGGLTVLGNVTSNGTISLGGDVTTQGSWTIGASGTQTNNSKAVFFTAATGNQTITRTGGGVVNFDYLVVNKAAGNVQLSASPATSVTLNTAAGDVLQLSNAGALDLNGQTLTLNNNGGSIAANAAGRSITSGLTGATLAITGTKSFNGAGTLVINTNVTTVLSGGFDFGVNKVTVNGVLQLNGGGFATNGSAPTYASGSTLLFNTGGNYDMHNGTADVAGWFRNVASTGSAQAGVPWNVTISNNTSVRYNSADNDVFPRSINGNLLINSGSSLTLGGLSGTAGDFFLRGNWTNNGTFNPNTRLVSFNGTTAQTITGATTFDFLTLNNSTGLTLQASSPVTVDQTLALTSGKITIGANNLTVGGLMTGYNATNYVVTASTGQLKRTVGGSAIDFPVGNTVYNPITFTNSGTSDTYGVRVSNTVPAGANNTKTVNRQWITTEAVAGGSNLAVTAQYNTGETGTGFAAATDYYIGHYNGTAYTQQVDATQSGSNPFTVASNSNLSPADLSSGTQYFAIGKDNGLVSVPYGYRVDTITPT